MASQPEPARADVSVIVPVYNVEPFIRECLDSVVGQTIGLDRIELIAVDDGSTDGSGAILDEYAARYPQVRVVHEPGSGGPGRPRNVGLDLASAPFVFFLDADDYLGPEALERLLGMAERNGSDIVLGRIVGIGGRRVPTAAFARNVDRAKLDLVYRTANVFKLFRRSLIERIRLRFTEGIAGGEDGAFTARAYFEAGTISVVADYDCYFFRHRAGSQTVRGDRRDDLVASVNRLDTDRMALVARYRGPGTARDALMAKHVVECARTFRPPWLLLDDDERRRVFDAAAVVIGRWSTPRIERRLAPWIAIRVYCLRHGLFAELEDIAGATVRVVFGDPIVEGDRVFARYPHFRDPSGIPDRCFEITRRVVPVQRPARAAMTGGRLELAGVAWLALVGGTTAVELRAYPRGPVLSFPVTVVPTPELRDEVVAYPHAGFEATIDLATAAGGRPITAGTWSLWLSVGTDEIRRTVALRAPRRPGPAGDPGADRAPSAVLYATRAGYLRVRVGRPHPAVALLERAEAAAVGVSRTAARATRSMPAGRRLARMIAERRPGVAGRLGED